MTEGSGSIMEACHRAVTRTIWAVAVPSARATVIQQAQVPPPTTRIQTTHVVEMMYRWSLRLVVVEESTIVQGTIRHWLCFLPLLLSLPDLVLSPHLHLLRVLVVRVMLAPLPVPLR